MKKIGIILLCILLSFPYTVFATDIDDSGFDAPFGFRIESDGRILLFMGMYALEPLKQAMYEKDNAIMFPVKELFERDREDKIFLLRDKQQKTMTLTVNDKKAIFFEGEKRVIVEGEERNLLVAPDFGENELFLAVDDVFVIFETMQYEPHRSYFTPDSYSITFGLYHNKVNLELPKEKNTKRSFQAWHTFHLKAGGECIRKEMVVTERLDSYEKEGTIMVAAADVVNLIGENTFLETVWNPQFETVSMRTWNANAGQAIFQKNSNVMFWNGEAVTMETAAEIKEGRFYIPISAMFCVLHVEEENITWIEQGKEVEFIVW